ncbi:MAG: exosortase H-associated membrane protein [Deltaproteobacteria bacterium]
MILSPLRRFLFSALLWLPLAFFFWFEFAAPLVWPVIAMAKLVLLKAWPSLFTAVSQGADLLDAHGRVLGHPGYLMQISSGVLVNVAAEGQPAKFGFLEPVVNPMIYGYALPLFAGLVLATPLTRWQRTRQIALGCAVIWVAQAIGVVAESLKVVGLDAGQPGLDGLQRAGIPPDAVALAYQFGYLILPVLVPAVLWIVCNRPFIEELIRPVREPNDVRTVEHPPSSDN